MSAFVVSKKHIDLMVFAAGKEVSETDRNNIGQALWNENFKSVNCRYNEKDAAPVYKYSRPERIYSQIEIIKACRCYNYQSCEHEGWEKSHAKQFSDAVVNEALKNYPEHTLESIQKTAEYDEAPWGID